MTDITTIEQLETLYGKIGAASIVKVSTHLTPSYRQYIQAAPFVALATAGPEGLDCSPRGDQGSVVIIKDDKTLLMPDRRGNNRIDSLRNIVRDPRVALMFLLPGSTTTIRVNGTARINADPELLDSLAVDSKTPRTVVIITINEVYFQCARALIRSKLWDQTAHVDPKSLPTPGAILAEMSDGAEGGEKYDREWPDRAAKTMW